MKRILVTILFMIICTFVFWSCDFADNDGDKLQNEYLFDSVDHWIEGEDVKEKHSFDGEKCSVCSFDKAYTFGVEYEVSPDSSYFYVKGYTGSSEIVVIEKEFNGIPVTMIMNNAFSGIPGVKKIIVPDSVTFIRMYAFAYCPDLESVVLPDSIENASGYLFTDSPKLSHIVFPDGVKLTNAESFMGTAYYNDKTNWDNGVLYVGNHLIKVDESYSGTLVIRDGTQTIASYAAMNCKNIKEIVIPSTVRTIGADAFSGCESLKSVELPESVIQISSKAFKDCTSLEEVILPENLQIIHSYAFIGCEKLTKIIIPSTVIKGGEKVFENCPDLVIYCRLPYRPADWSANWIGGTNDEIWGYTGD